MTKELELTFKGSASLNNDLFTQIEKTSNSYLYKRENSEFKTLCYEVFLRKEVHLFDFETKVQLEDKKVRYPKNEDFGVWAWCFTDLDMAKAKLDSL